MISGIFYAGSGLGDQLFRYITVRTLAEDKGFKWGMENPSSFKGDEFMSIDKGTDPELGSANHDFIRFNEKVLLDENQLDIRSYDPEINFVEDTTIIDGSFEDDKYWRHKLLKIDDWLQVEPMDVSDDVCLVGFRGGEYAAIPELFLGPEYYQSATKEILKRKNIRKFEVHTDDPKLAKTFFPPDYGVIENQQISHSKHMNMGFNWRSARYAKYAIIPNSAFYIIPRLLKHQDDPTSITIAPRYWARHNTKTWARPACYYPEFRYI